MTDPTAGPAPSADRPRRGRLVAVDAARGIAIVAMVIYHFAWDLTFFDLAEIDLFGDPFWLGFRAVILSSFMAVAGLAQALAAARGIDLRRWARRLAVLAAAAGLITLATWATMGDRFIWFGVLHHLTLASLVGLAAVRLTWPAIAALAAVALALDATVSLPAFNAPWIIWLGLGTYMPATNDWVPVFPWIGIYLAGLALGKALAGPIGRLPDGRSPLWRGLARAGRWSLPIYLVHQPLLLGTLWLAVTLFGLGEPGRAERLSAFTESCVTACASQGPTEAQCRAYCGCMVDGLEREDLLDAALEDRLGGSSRITVDELVIQCRAHTESPAPGN